MALGRSSRNGKKPKWVVLHSAEGSRRRQDLYDFFNRNQNASSHVGIDGGGFDDWIDSVWAAWTLLNGNSISVNAELCAFARWTRAQWLSTGTVDGVVNPRAMVRAAAMWAKRECERWGIPKKYIGVDGVRRGEAGIIIHWDYSRGTGDGDHWDTGENFPYDVFFADMNGGQESEDDVSAEDVLNAPVPVGYDGKQNPLPLREHLRGTNFGVWENHAIAVRLEQGQAALIAAVAALSKNGALTADQIKGIVDNAVREANTAHLAAQKAQLEQTTATFREILAERDESLADEVMNELGQRLTAA